MCVHYEGAKGKRWRFETSAAFSSPTINSPTPAVALVRNNSSGLVASSADAVRRDGQDF